MSRAPLAVIQEVLAAHTGKPWIVTQNALAAAYRAWIATVDPSDQRTANNSWTKIVVQAKKRMGINSSS